MFRSVIGSTLVVGLLGAGSVAHAEAGPPELVAASPTVGKVQLQAQFQWGHRFGEDGNPYGFGFGVEAGYTFENHIYVGAAFDYFFGQTESVLGFEANVRSWTLAAEGGYDVALSDSVVLRPKLGLGAHVVTADACIIGSGCTGMSEAHFGITPAIEAIFGIGPLLVSAEVRATLDTQAFDGSGAAVAIGVGSAF